MIADWIKRGDKLIYPERRENWTRCVHKRANDIYEGKDLTASLNIMSVLENDAPIEEAVKYFNFQNHDEHSGAVIRGIVFCFSKRGPEFYEAVSNYMITPAERIALNVKRQENEQLANKHSKEEKKLIYQK